MHISDKCDAKVYNFIFNLPPSFPGAALHRTVEGGVQMNLLIKYTCKLDLSLYREIK